MLITELAVTSSRAKILSGMYVYHTLFTSDSFYYFIPMMLSDVLTYQTASNFAYPIKQFAG